ncbi:F0F1 ATP synthase subunit B [Gloeobacter kilaueensis]|uniref:ATP synthase subunit b n=1 Tax=Gloeobacter kilaueensis (strain ATCC BAA-2537 / CCAP 1431/1 / ULC 316 / JS1) TaxID=1183438 RepID=U5QLJ6_GLOK1|nr:F0F1 ATP synthase subunit B [Gloeobacter kilaueensis]AGY58479.1 F0F1 ATP synthase subunit B [Gloeobacter kilaueensis JS1]
MSLLAPLLAQVEIPEHRFGLNLDLLNTNLLNIVIVFGLLFWLGRGYLGRILGERRAEIESSIREVEDRGRQAEQELVVARNNLSTAQAQAQQILAEARTNAERVRTQVLDQAQADIARIRDSIEQDLQSEQQRALAQVRLQVIRDALSRLQQRLPGELDEQTQRRLLDQSIQLLD